MSGGPPAPLAGSAPASIPDLLGRYPVGGPPTGTAGAAVTIVLRQGRAEVEALLIERAESESDPASGQVGLPGGHVDDEDTSLERTALRELHEEVGLGETDLEGRPRFVETRLAARFHLKVAIFVGELAPKAKAPIPASRTEVAHVFWLPRSALAHARQVPRDTPLGWIEVTATVHDGHILWGFTRRVLRDFFGFPPEDELGGLPFAPQA
ncbi:MAG TPA: NUDIX domain-containing protein [Thermoplasmata archaeon]|nr:NUDIX domain-containing protein [Thermoplasmata archaeon]